MENLFDFLDKVYGKFGMELKFGLSTRNPKKFMGDLAVWDKAEATLKDVLEKFQKGNWEIFPEDAAVRAVALLLKVFVLSADLAIFSACSFPYGCIVLRTQDRR